MAQLEEVFQQAEAAFAEGRYVEATADYLRVVQGAPQNTRSRYRIADSLLNLGQKDRALEVYKGLAWHYIKSGQPLLGLVACKMVLALEPAWDDILHILAELYSSESDRVAEVDPPERLPLASRPAPESQSFAEPDTLLEAASQIAADTDPITSVPERLPLIPLFSHLAEEAFIKVLGSLRLRRFTPGEPIINEGEIGNSFFMLADGEVAISRRINQQDVTLARLHEGAVFGEMALVSHAPRAATVRATSDVDALELSREDLENHAGELESVQQALRKFTRGRFLANLAATSPLFRPLSKPERRVLMSRFQPQKVFPGDVLIEQGEAGRGLYLIMRGEFSVTADEGGQQLSLARLGGGEVFGEMSLLRGEPTNATVRAASIAEVLFLPRQTFSEVLQQHPTVAETLMKMSAERLKARQYLKGEIVTDDASVLL